MYVYVCFYVCAPCVCMMSMDIRKAYKFPGNRILFSYEPTCRCWELNPGPLQKQQGF